MTTLATIHPKAHGHNDVRELQVRLEQGAITLWMMTPRGPVLLRDRHMLDQLAAALRRRGLGAEQAPLHMDAAAREEAWAEAEALQEAAAE
jgi:hypothetical protein